MNQETAGYIQSAECGVEDLSSGLGYVCSLAPGHQGPHEAWWMHEVRPIVKGGGDVNLLSRWGPINLPEFASAVEADAWLEAHASA